MDLEVKGDVEERGNKENSTSSRGVLRKLFLVGKKMEASPCNQSKNVEPVYSFSPVQNGRPFSVKALNTGGRSDAQIVPGGSMLQCPTESKLEEVRKDLVEGDSLSVHVLVFWTRPSTTGVYKVIENSSLTP